MARKTPRPAPTLAGLDRLEPRVHLSADFNGDGRDDLVWHNEETGANAVWYRDANGTTGPLQSVRDTDWLVAEAGDFNNDGKGDLLWRNRVTGANGIWLMDGTARTSSAWIPQLLDQAWRVRGVGDLDGDGDADILWHNLFTGALAIWRMDGVQRVGVEALPAQADSRYQPAGVGDADGDGDGDIYWVYAPPNSRVYADIWIMEDGSRVSIETRSADFHRQAHFLPVAVRDLNGDGIGEVLLRAANFGANTVLLLGPAPTQITFRHIYNIRGWVARDADPDRADFTRDGVGDLLWRDSGTGVNEGWSFNIGRGLVRRFTLSPVPDTQWSIAGVADFDGDGNADILWRSSISPTPAIWYMLGTLRLRVQTVADIAPEWEIIAAADLTDDARADLLLHNTSTGQMSVRHRFHGSWTSTDLGALPAGNFQFRALADMDRSGVRDLVWRDDTADLTLVWLLRHDLTHVGTVDLSSPGIGWSLESAADFDRDGSHDLLWRHRGAGLVRLWRMNATTPVQSINLAAFAAANVLIGARDLDGDRHVEIVFHHSVTGVVTVWRMRGVTRHSVFEAGVQPPSWRVHFPR